MYDSGWKPEGSGIQIYAPGARVRAKDVDAGGFFMGNEKRPAFSTAQYRKQHLGRVEGFRGYGLEDDACDAHAAFLKEHFPANAGALAAQLQREPMLLKFRIPRDCIVRASKGSGSGSGSGSSSSSKKGKKRKYGVYKLI